MRNLGWLAAGALLLVACGGGDDGGTTPNTSPTADFDWSCAELTCSFTDASTDDGSITARSWDFGDDATSTDEDPVHTYSAAGSYDVTLTVTDDDGATGSTTIAVEPVAPSEDYTCTDDTSPGSTATCTLTLPEAAARVTAVLDAATTCEADGNSFVFTSPVAATLTTDGCNDAGASVELTGPFNSGTQILAEVKSGLSQYGTGVRVTGEYPEWILYVEDAVGATFPEDYDDMIVRVTAEE
jgi:PKD repeat protein